MSNASLIRVNPVSLRQYADKATAQFEAARKHLADMIQEAVDVRYEGTNAFKFKTELGNATAEYANILAGDLGKIAAAVSASTSSIAGSLGGVPVQVQFNAQTLQTLTPRADEGISDVNTDGLTALIGTIDAHFKAVATALNEHRDALAATDWVGAAKESANGLVGKFTNEALADIQTASEGLGKRIQQQIDLVHSADNVAVG